MSCCALCGAAASSHRTRADCRAAGFAPIEDGGKALARNADGWPTSEQLAEMAHRAKPVGVSARSEEQPRVVTFMTGNSRFGVLRQVVIPEPEQHDRWGRRIKPGLFR